MRILQAVSFFSPKRGAGVIATVYDLSRALTLRGNDVTIFTSDFEVDQNYIDSLSDVKVYTFHNYLKLANRPFLASGAIRKVRAELMDFDVIHTHECRSFLNLVLYYYARKYGIPYIVDAHGATTRNTSNSKLKWLLDIIYGRRILKDATRVIAETELAISEYEKAGVNKDKIVTIYPPFPVDNYSSIPPQGRFREKFNIKKKHILTFMGRISRIKGVDFLVQAFHELSQQRADVILVIIGTDDGYKDLLEEMIERLNLSEIVLFTGYLAGDDKMSALVDSTIMIQPSTYEQGLPKPCIEAILCDTPIIISKDTGAAVIAKRMNAGYLIEFGNKPELVNTVQHVLDNLGEANDNVQKAKQYIKEHLSMECGIEKYERLYADCVEVNNH